LYTRFHYSFQLITTELSLPFPSACISNNFGTGTVIELDFINPPNVEAEWSGTLMNVLEVPGFVLGLENCQPD
jgi:hypothetical protein